MAKLMTCTCCGAEITMPQFYNGKPYGYTCITKIAPKQKQVNEVMFLADLLRVDQPNANQGRVYPVVLINGNKVKLPVTYTQTLDFDNLVGDGYRVVNGVVYVNKMLNDKFPQKDETTKSSKPTMQDAFAALAALNK